MNADTNLENLFEMDARETSEEMFMIHRCISRLSEMQTDRYMQEKHQPDPSLVV